MFGRYLCLLCIVYELLLRICKNFSFVSCSSSGEEKRGAGGATHVAELQKYETV